MTNPCIIERWWCGTSIKLPKPIRTPLGSRVTLVKVCVDVCYEVQDGDIILHGVSLARPKENDSFNDANVAAERTGEAWIAVGLFDDSELLEVVRRELYYGSPLRRVMFGKWYSLHRDYYAQSLVNHLNEGNQSPQKIAKQLRAAGRGTEITFTYTKPDGSAEVRHVSIRGVSGRFLYAIDHKDNMFKSFQIDRITQASLPSKKAHSKSNFRTFPTHKVWRLVRWILHLLSGRWFNRFRLP